MNLTINSSLTSASQSLTISGASSADEQTKVAQEEEQSTSSSTVQYTATSSQGDTLEISDEGQTASSTTTSSTTTDLSSYSETQLKEMYNNGEITLAQYQEALSELEEQ